MKRLAILSTHPIQYNAPLFRLLADDQAIGLKVFYSKKSDEVRYDKDFGREVVWDIPLTESYEHESFEASSRPGQKQLIHAIEQFDPAALLVFGWNFPGHWATMRHFKGRVPVWFRGDSTLIDPLPFWKKALRKLLLTQVYRSVDRAFYVGKANKRYFLWAGLKEKQLTYAPHAVDNEYFMRDDEERRRQAVRKRKELGIAPDAIVFMFVGKLESKKQPELLGRAFQNVQSESTHLVFLGSGALEDSLKREFRVLSNVHFVGFQNQGLMPIWYRVANVLCLPSKGPGETWGLAVNEAMACGCQAIVSDRVGCAMEFEKITPDSIHVFPWNDANALSSCMQTLAEKGPTNQPTEQALHAHFNFVKLQDALLGALNDSAVESTK